MLGFNLGVVQLNATMLTTSALTPSTITSTTFTRGSTATIYNYIDALHTTYINELRYAGYVRNNNQCRYTEDFANVAWATSGDIVVTSNTAIAPDGSSTADNIVFGGSVFGFVHSEVVIVGGTASKNIVVSCFVKGTGNFRFKNTHGGIVDTYSPNIVATSEWHRYAFIVNNANLAGSGVHFVGITSGDPNIASNIDVWGFSVNDVTGESQAPHDYISSDVLSSPYQGAYTDGVNFTQVSNVNTISSSLVTEGHTDLIYGNKLANIGSINKTWNLLNTTATSVLAPDGSYNAFRITASSGANWIRLSSAFTVKPSTSYTMTFWAKRGTSTNSRYIIVDQDGVGLGNSGYFYYNDINSTTWTQITTSFTTVPSSTNVNVWPISDMPIGDMYIWDVSVVEDDVTYGMILEESRTNLCLYSDDIDNAVYHVISGGISSVDGATAPDGTTNATTFTITTSAHIARAGNINVTENTDYVYTFYAQTGTVTADVRYSVLNVTAFNNILAPTDYFNQLDGTNWTRIEIPFTTPAGCTTVQISCLRDGTGLGTMNIWGMQLEKSNFATSYIPTAATSTTRSSDVYSKIYTDISNDITITLDNFVPKVIPSTLIGTYIVATGDSRGINNIVSVKFGNSYVATTTTGGMDIVVDIADFTKDVSSKIRIATYQINDFVKVIIDIDDTIKLDEAIFGFTLDHSNNNILFIGHDGLNSNYTNATFGDEESIIVSSGTPLASQLSTITREFSPNDFAPAVWFDADDDSTITQSSNLVSQWRDKSGNNRHAYQNNSGDQPELVPNTLNGKNVIRGTSSTMLYRNFDINSLHNITMLFIMKIPTEAEVPNNSFKAIMGFGTSAEARLENWGSGEVDSLRVQSLDKLGNSTEIADGLTTGYNLVTISSNDNSTQTFKNGAIFNTWSTNTPNAWITGAGNYSLFSSNDTGRSIHADLAEVIIYKQSLNEADRQQVENYLTTKWNI